ncbi:MAG: hypothetical protein ACXV74_00585 [Methylobacter sp.]
MPVPHDPPVAEKLVFIPPTSAPATRSKMNIAILKPGTGGSFFVTDTQMSLKSRASINRVSEAMQTDIEKIIISRGFTTAGSYPNIDEMTYSQKEHASLILKPTVNLDLFTTGTQGTVSGTVTLELLEPMSREKVWIKRLDLTPITKNIKLEFVQVQTPQGPNFVHVISTNSVIELMNAFYTQTMEKIWNHLDAQEINSLKSDTDKLKSKTQYRGG